MCSRFTPDIFLRLPFACYCFPAVPKGFVNTRARTGENTFLRGPNSVNSSESQVGRLSRNVEKKNLRGSGILPGEVDFLFSKIFNCYKSIVSEIQKSRKDDAESVIWFNVICIPYFVFFSVLHSCPYSPSFAYFLFHPNKVSTLLQSGFGWRCQCSVSPHYR